MTLRQWGQNGDYVVNLVAMSPRCCFVLVEGDADYRFLSNCIREHLSVIPVHKKPQLLRACESLNRKGAANYIALADADFDALLARNVSLPRLIYVSLADSDDESCLDMESAIIRTESLRKLSRELVGPAIDRFGGAAAFEHRMREWARATASLVGAFRASAMEAYHAGERFIGIGDIADHDWQQFVCFADGTVDTDALKSFMAARIKPSWRADAICTRSQEFLDTFGQGWLLCRGHDLTQLLASRFSAIVGRAISRSEIESKLRLGFDKSMLTGIAFGKHLRHFEEHTASLSPGSG